MNCRFDDLSDAELLALARGGDGPAYGVLFKRHWHAGRAMAASVTSRFEPDDLASEAFARILKAVEKGNGPKTGFRSYLATTIRNVAIDWSRRKSTPNIEDADVIEDWTYSEVTALERMERETMAKAFYALPDSWQEVLWYTEVEDMAPREVAPLLGLTPNAVSALAIRAREGLRQSWINAHLAEAATDEPEHAWVLSKLGSHARGKLSRTDRVKVDHHLAACRSCADAAEEAGRVGSRLAMGILPLFLGISGAVAYAAWTTERSGSAVAATLSAGQASHVPAAHAASSGAGHTVRTAGRLRHLLSAGASASNTGIAAVAAVVAAAVLTTGAVIAAPQSSMADGKSTSEPAKTPPGPEKQRKEHGSSSADGQAGPEAREPENQGDNATAPPSAVPAPPAGDTSDVVPPVADPPGTEQERAGAPAEPAPPTGQQPPVHPDVSAQPEPPAQPGPPVQPEPPQTPETPGETPTDPALPPTPQEDVCEAAIRLVPADQTVFGYRLDDPAGSTTATDMIHGLTGRYAGTPDQPGWTLADSTRRPSTDDFTVQIRFKTTVGGGRLIGFSSATEGNSRDFDRHLFLTDDGRVAFGVWPGTVRVIASPQSYSDDTWHQATATLSAAGMKLYVDGELVAEDASVTRGQAFTGNWRIGYESMFNWGPLEPKNWVFAGTLAHAAVYSTALTAEQIAAQWRLCGG